MIRNYIILLSIFLIPVIFTIFTISNILVSPITYALWLTIVVGIFTTAVYISNYLKSGEIKAPLVEEFRAYKVAALVVSYNEDPSTIKETLFSVREALDSLGDLFLLDDSTDIEKVRENEDFCNKNNINYVHRENRRGYKAGAINDFLKKFGKNYDLIAVFDSDQRPVKSFFFDLLPFFNDPEIAFVQVPQAYTEIYSRLALGATYQQMPFHNIVMSGRDVTGSAFILGSGFIARISALEKANYFDENIVTEDLATSLKLHSLGYKSIYVNYPGIWYGEPPQTVDAYMIQQGRWSLGSFQAFGRILKTRINTRAFLDYLAGVLYWLKEGPLTIVELLAPIIFINFQLFIFKVDPVIFSLAYYPVFLFSIILFVYSMRERSYGISGFLYHQFVEFLMMPPVTLSFIAWISGRKRPFRVTPKGKEIRISRWIILYIIIEIILIISIIKGIFWYLSSSELALKYSIIVNLSWIFYFLFINTGTFIIFLERRK
ncbi:MAG: glycosyltransferase family 2 protein [Thermoplasmata archaeon]